MQCGSFNTRMLLNGKKMILATRIWTPSGVELQVS